MKVKDFFDRHMEAFIYVAVVCFVFTVVCFVRGCARENTYSHCVKFAKQHAVHHCLELIK